MWEIKRHKIAFFIKKNTFLEKKHRFDLGIY